MSVLISIHYGHDSTVGLSVNGTVKCVISEERLNRIKKSSGFPFNAYDYVLNTYLNGDKSKIDKIVFTDATLDLARHMNKRGFDVTTYKPKPPIDREREFNHFFKYLNRNSLIGRLFAKKPKPKTIDREMLMGKLVSLTGVNKEKIKLVDHHDAHILAGLYFIDSAKTYLCFSHDGGGDNSFGKVCLWKNGKLECLSNSSEVSLGLLYHEVTRFMGMKPNEHEFKIMGMAPYAKQEYVDKLKERFEKLMFINEQGNFESILPTRDYFSYIVENFTFERFDNLCGAIQTFTEEILIKWIKFWIKKTGVSDVTLSGGVMMNVKAVKRIYEIPEISSIFVMPSSGDESLVIGGLFSENFESKQKVTLIKDLYLGRDTTDEEIEKYLKTISDRYIFNKYDEAEMAKKVAFLLANNEIVARCTGKDEWGARALGNRSIMCNPSHFNNINILNQYIKSRDFWMPFTPSILSEDLDDYIVNPRQMNAPYMCITFDSTEKARKDIPAALHPQDYTVRPQAVFKEWNPGYHAIISEFKKLTGISGVLNTSFNLHGEPNVSNYKDAIHTLDNSRLKYVIIGSYLVEKKQA